MSNMFSRFLQKLTFQRQLSITVTLGILFLALFSSLVGSWRGNERVRHDLIEQGQHITENLARQSTLALVYSSADNAAGAVNITMAFPGVIGVEIRHADGGVLLARGEANLAEFIEQVGHIDGLQAAVLNAESGKAWHFAAPVYSQPSAESPFNEASAPELLGQVSVIMSKAALARMTTDLFISNLTTSFSFALLFLFLLRFLTLSITRPLNHLSDSMGRAQRGESQVRAVPGGPKDIAEMAYAFNSMMSEQEERESALRIAAIAFETDESMMVTDENALIIRVNRAFTQLTGYSAEEVIGKDPSLLNSAHQDAGFYQQMWESLHQENSWQGEILNRRKNGEDFPAWLSITAVVGKDGKVTNYVGAFVDFTERKRAELEIHNSMLQLEEKELAKSRFLAAAGHDLRQPLAAANLFIDALKFMNPTADQSQIIQRLDHAMSNFNNLLDALLNVSKLDAGTIKPEFTSIPVADIFNWLEESFAALANEKHLGFKSHYSKSKTLVVRCDIGLLKSVLMNLLSNAIKFTSKGSILVSARRRGADVLFQVWDTGIGIQSDGIEKIYDDFFQIDNPQRDRTKGLGLGLSIAKRALTLLGGKISCHSQLGRGSVFEFSLPLDIAADKNTHPHTVAASHANMVSDGFGKGKSFIVVEDDKLVAQAMINWLEGMSGKVKCFYSAEDALRQANIKDDYYIVDYMLGGTLNGVQFLNQLRQKLDKPINAVLLTGDTSPAFIRESAKCDWPVLHKPANMSKLISSLSAQAR